MKILKELFGNKQLEEELDESIKKCDFLKNELARILTNNNLLREELKNYESLKEKIQIKDREIKNLKFENENQKDELIKCKIFQRELEVKLENLEKKTIEEKIEKERVSEELLKAQEEKSNLKKEKVIKDSIEKSSTWSCTDYNEYLKNKDRLNEYLSTFSEDDFRKIHSLGKEKNIFNTFDERQILTVITWLKWGTPLSKLNTDKINELYIKFMEEYHKTPAVKVDEIEVIEEKAEVLEEIKIDSKETEIQEEKKEIKLVTKWSDYEKYLENKNDLVPLLRKFTESDFKEIYIEAKNRKILKPSQERDFSNIMTRLKLKLPLTDMSFEKIELSYEKLIEDIHKDKVQKVNQEKTIDVQEYTAIEDNIKEEENTISENYMEIEEIPNIKTFCNVLSEGLKNGVVEMEELKQVDYDNDKDAYDVYEAIEILESRGVRIKY
ncbi:hypothetical protein ACQ9ZF_03590 [Cetobacterium somerae]|uniref:hypothetical protein n=1 Tax=Cetobacterium somerae TaxID=188913 RepID=UPI003D7672CF